ncbi:hypothetical protein ONZ43_g5687 [Nemania bipapillata]|uniref:Uncharacterized protein n=1 Tax=Nemania bipapillata TaxID=110536 RepID=A0ACC2I7N0_9PEZI|nr:hypothetical protein ONZ43_g5687 [Nemania bipapillata]
MAGPLSDIGDALGYLQGGTNHKRRCYFDFGSGGQEEHIRDNECPAFINTGFQRDVADRSDYAKQLSREHIFQPSSRILSDTHTSHNVRTETTSASAAAANGSSNQIIQDQTSNKASTSTLSVPAIAGIAGGVGGAVLIVSTLFVLHRVWRKRRHGTPEAAIDNTDPMYETGRPEGFNSTDRLVRWNKGLSEYHHPDANQAYKAYRM